jgi:subtilisin
VKRPQNEEFAQLIGCRAASTMVVLFRLFEQQHDEGQASKAKADRFLTVEEHSMKTARRLLLVLVLTVAGVGQTPRSSAQENEPAGRNVLIGFRSASSFQTAEVRAAVVWQAGGIVHASFELIPVVSAWVSPEVLETLLSRPDVNYVEDDVLLYAFEQATPWGVDRIDADLVWPGGNTGAGVDVAILDTGIDGQHPDLAVVGGINFVGSGTNDGSTNPTDWNDGHGHGTHCAGIVAALDNDIGVVGVAPGARLHAVKVLNDSGFGSTSDIIQGLEWCVAHHMHIVSMSLGGGGTTSFEQACDSAYAAGVLLVAAAGNYHGPVSAPAMYASVIAVSATDSQDALAFFSNFGPEVELAAPGVNVYSTFKGGAYTTLSGTSMSCPHVAGVAALVWAGGAPSNTAVRDTLAAAAEDLGAAGRDPSFGYGLVDAQKAAATPVVQITNPAGGATVSGTVVLEAIARGTNGIARVEFFVETTSIGADTDGTDGWSVPWDTKGTANGAHEVAAVAVDTLGQTARHSINVVVDNAVPPGPTAMHVAAIDMWSAKASRGYFIYTEVAVVDDSLPTPQPVSGVTVVVTSTLPNGWSATRAAVTGPDGTATVSVQAGSGGTCTSTVTDITDSLTYDPAANLETTDSCTVP